MLLLVTSDSVDSSGGTVTSNEFQALKLVNSEAEVLQPPAQADPFLTDQLACQEYKQRGKKYELAHFYAGTYSELVRLLKEDGTKITYTAAAHDIDLSREEHAKMGMPFDYPHLNDPALFEKYVRGYAEADMVICPSMASKKLMEGYGCKKVKVIPHGCHRPSHIKPFPGKFTVGYLGQVGPDKGLPYLIEAWSKLNYSDSQMVIAGRNSQHVLPLLRNGRGSVFLAGYLQSVSFLYDYCTIYVQPSVTEGFGMEIVEAMSYGRPIVCSDGAGAADCVKEDTGKIVPKRDVNALVEAIDFYKKNPDIVNSHGKAARIESRRYEWDVIKTEYVDLWGELLGKDV